MIVADGGAGRGHIRVIGVGGRRLEWWQRVLLVLGLIVGVVTMHAVAGCAQGHSGAAAAHSVLDGASGQIAAEMPAESSRPAPMPAPMPALQDLLDLCLAVLAGAIALGVARLLAVLAHRHVEETRPTASHAPRDVARPPPPTSVRLAQLCVLRN